MSLFLVLVTFSDRLRHKRESQSGMSGKKSKEEEEAKPGKGGLVSGVPFPRLEQAKEGWKSMSLPDVSLDSLASPVNDEDSINRVIDSLKRQALQSITTNME
ncbi:uncharacterized protein BO66DRAFT_114803 [Aspergillus aculeatinus CBS 121060]|uniref:Uncharacterized protein n=1 Tax=Aspergillus aculeatinus CBS 121060 TaxID=1448322 RepID=A0ACD1H6D8_9EURO|nr:hypothetical protein BO66DRAFT_114803 [Aspergillus aculeatinus CBS 121060]RAH69073.1 hypothetical protein BO66DRAFT_114803 [Aspergillus aculeatinus CBS 121060]